ncbi:outer membrane exchange protein TraA family protein [Polyangium mundeleinium]|uniref:Outer membrane exchange protein TraA family protein n=1 Tax=Polyangium mundeleinium TaxID=2995306 RepID=A0ABT5EFX4_9BACT|nr:outer membrane exchange protein TraA family protein [Polyangium mundeleinium]MDC0740715.1 outer membrane exchange protein TraA family protein [Polyangium mundeleinium]
MMKAEQILVGSLLGLALAPATARAEPVTVPEGVADALAGPGTGLCAASAIATNPSTDFNLPNPGTYTESINTFIEAHAADRVEQVIRTPLDLSNNNASGVQLSHGDFIDAALQEGCKTGGCDFFVNDTTTAFASRMRGFFNVTADLANKPIHFGLYTDDTVSLTVYDKEFTAYPVVVRPAEIGISTWRVTNQVTFSTPGLYPIEILYTQIAEHAALELSYFVGDFEDFARPANTLPIVKLNDAGFTLFPSTSFFQTVNGNPSFPDLGLCKQCERQFVNQAGDNGCDAGHFCNEAALCAPCDTDKHCGSSCSPCGADTPFCVNLNGDAQCAACRTDADCQGGATCDPTTRTCEESSSPAGSGGAGGSGGGGGGGNGGGGNGGGGSGGGGSGGTDVSCGYRAASSSSHAGIAGILCLVSAAMAYARSRRRASSSSRR